jgi:hypothetical protein
MPCLPNVILDFDGTLVLQNSSRILESVIFTEIANSRGAMLRRIYESRSGAINALFAAITRLARGRDGRLLLLLGLTRHLIRGKEQSVFERTAERLELTPEIAKLYTQPFIILSNGLEPIIQAFLRRHPELYCRMVSASSALITRGGLRISLRSPSSKATILYQCRPYRYVTDHAHEALILEAALPWHNSVSVEDLPDGRRLYMLSAS